MELKFKRIPVNGFDTDDTVKRISNPTPSRRNVQTEENLNNESTSARDNGVYRNLPITGDPTNNPSINNFFEGQDPSDSDDRNLSFSEHFKGSFYGDNDYLSNHEYLSASNPTLSSSISMESLDTSNKSDSLLKPDNARNSIEYRGFAGVMTNNKSYISDTRINDSSYGDSPEIKSSDKLPRLSNASGSREAAFYQGGLYDDYYPGQAILNIKNDSELASKITDSIMAQGVSNPTPRRRNRSDQDSSLTHMNPYLNSEVAGADSRVSNPTPRRRNSNSDVPPIHRDNGSNNTYVGNFRNTETNQRTSSAADANSFDSSDCSVPENTNVNDFNTSFNLSSDNRASNPTPRRRNSNSDVQSIHQDNESNNTYVGNFRNTETNQGISSVISSNSFDFSTPKNINTNDFDTSFNLSSDDRASNPTPRRRNKY